jgi:hypothetical protein
MVKGLFTSKITEVLRLHHECLSSQRDIALAVGVGPTTVSGAISACLVTANCGDIICESYLVVDLDGERFDT